MKTLSRSQQRIRNRQLAEFEALGPIPTAPQPVGRILISAVTRTAIRGRGKVEPTDFFPTFLKRLCDLGWQPQFVFDEDELVEKVQDTRPVVLLNLFNEEFGAPLSVNMNIAEQLADVTFNPSRIGPIMRDKRLTNSYLTKRGIRMPEMDVKDGHTIFSNQSSSTSKPAWLTSDLSSEDAVSRYNTRYIDTRRSFAGKEYFITLRVLACGPHIIHGFIGASDVSRENPSVHGVDTPRDPTLVQHLFETMFEARYDELQRTTHQLDQIWGHGFYHHDFIIEKDTDHLYLCETGIKFDAFAFYKAMSSIADDAPCLTPLNKDVFAPKKC
ncbi:hypothetical protein [Pseudaestuariivita rosea]|uniref:hypothetical protein n=1 Tax=Pseudaestuariivita rosea TaxID=2763263 RepID=UPI001ABB4CDA|nr:hypothetical protein [Pseudaestuariivita rosea]